MQKGARKLEAEGLDVWKNQVQQDITELKNGRSLDVQAMDKIKDDIRNLQIKDQLQDKEISTLKETLSDIKEDTNWIRRKITGAIITAVITAVVGGIIAFAITNIFRG